MILHKTIIVILFIFQYLQQSLQQKCQQGCKKCEFNEQQQNICLECEQSYKKNSSNNCIYQLCDQNLFFTQNKSKSTLQLNDQDKCVSICDDMFYQNKDTNICEYLNQCSQQFQTKDIVFQQSAFQDFGLYDQYFVELNQGVITLISKERGELLKQFTLVSNDLKAFLYRNQIYVFTKSQELYLWNLIENKRSLIVGNIVGDILLNSQIIEIDNSLGSVIVLDNQKMNMLVYPFYNVKDMIYILTNQAINIKLKSGKWQSMSKGIFTQSLKESLQILVLELSINQKQLEQTSSQISIECILQNQTENIIDIQIFPNNKNRLSIITADQQVTIVEINKNTQQCKIISKMESKYFKQLFQKYNNNYFMVAINNTTLDIFILDDKISIFKSVKSQADTIYVDVQFGQTTLSKQNQLSIYILENQTATKSFTLKIHDQDSININNFITQSYSVLIPSPTKLISVVNYYNNKSQLDYIVIYNNDFEVIWRNQENILNSYVLSNFRSLYPSSLARGEIIQLQLFNDFNILVSCSGTGIISFFDLSQGFYGTLITEIKFTNNKCFNVQKLNENLAVLLMNTDIKLIDIQTFKVKKSIDHNSQTQDQIIIRTNNEQAFVKIQNCFYIYDSSFTIIFQNCEDPVIKSSLKVFFLSNLKILSIQNNKIAYYQLSLDSKIIFIKEKLMTDNLIYSKVLFKQISKVVYDIEEILLYTSNLTLNIISPDFEQTQKVDSLIFKSIVNIQRTQNDMNVYKILGAPFTEAIPVQSVIFSKISQKRIQFTENRGASNIYPLYATQKSNGQIIYHSQSIGVTPRFSVALRIDYNLNDAVIREMGLDFVPLYTQSTNILSSDLKLDYVGTSQGFIGINPKIYDRYERLKIDPANIDEFFLDIQQSISLNKYFLVTNQRIVVFNIHTDEVINLNLFFDNKTNITKAQIFEDNKSVICIRQNKLQIRYFKDTLETTNEFVYSGMSQIKDYIYISGLNQLILYGSNLTILNTNLEKLNEKIPKSGIYENCILVQKLIYCKLDSGSIQIIDIQTLEVKNSFVITQMASSFKMFIDQQYQNIILYEKSINIYDINMNFKKQIEQSFGLIDKCNVHDSYLILFTPTTGLIYNRQTFAERKRIQDLGGAIIQKYVYVKEMNQLLFFANIIGIAQIFVYNLISESVVGKIKPSQTTITLGIPKDVMFDKALNFFSYVDSEGNFYMYDFNDPYTSQNYFRIEEIQNLNESLLLFSVNYISNNVFVLSNKGIYKVNHNTFANRCQYFFKEPFKYYSTYFNKQLNQTDYLALGQNSVLFRYSNQVLSYELRFQEQPNDFRYIQDSDILVIAFQTQLFIYYQYSQKLNKQFVKSNEIRFWRFIKNDIIQTLDKRIIFYDYQNNSIKYEFNLILDEIITSHIYLSERSLLVIGTNQGRFYQLDPNLKQGLTFQSQNNNIKQINFIQLSIDKITLNICSSDGQIMEFNLDKQDIKEYDLLNKIGRSSEKGSIKLSSLMYDEQYKRLMFNFLGEKKKYVWDIKNDNLVGYITYANTEYNQIIISENFYFLQSSFQINIYLRNNLALANSIKRNTYYDQLIGFHVFSESFLGLFFYQKIEIFYFNPISYSTQLIDQQTMVYPVLMGFYFKLYNESNSQVLFVIGYNSNGIFEKRYSTQYYTNSNQKNQCGIKLIADSYFNLEKQFSSIQFRQEESYFQYGTTVKSITDWKNIIFLSNQQNLLNLLSQKEEDLNSFILSSPQSNGSESFYQEIILQNEYFQQFKGKDIQMKDVTFKFNQDSSDIVFNDLAETITLQNTKIEGQSILDKRIYFKNLQKVTIQNLQITQLSNNVSKRVLTNSYQFTQSQILINNSLLYFENIAEVYIYDVEISRNQFNNSNIIQQLFQFKNVKNISIKRLNVIENLLSGNVFYFEIIDKLDINNFNASLNNLNSSSTIQDISIIKITGSLVSILNNLEILKNTDIQFMTTYNAFQQNNQTIFLNQDQLYINHLKIQQNNLDLKIKNLINLQTSNIFIDDINMSQNKGSIQIGQVSQLVITNSKFNQNTGVNGGAINILNIQNKFRISSTLFEQNEALASGGSIYIDTIQCQPDIQQDVTIINNKALIGGGLRIINFNEDTLNQEEFEKKIKINSNQAQLYGDNFATYLNRIFIEKGDDSQFITIDKMNVEFTQEIQNGGVTSLNLSNVKSGGQMKLRIKFLDNTGRELVLSREKVNNNQYPTDIINELKGMNIQLISTDFRQVQLSGETILNFNLFNETTKAFEFKDVFIYGNPLEVKKFQMQIYQFKKSIKIVEIISSFRACLHGEIIGYLSNNIQICQFCGQGFYSLDDPLAALKKAQTEQNSNQSSDGQSSNKVECKKCPTDSALSCEGNQIQLKNGYWRKNIQTDEILECNSQIDSCKPQDPNNINGCIHGYVGPLCEECDYLGEVWGESYTKKQFSKGQCEICSQVSIQSIYLFSKVLIPMTYFFFSSRIFLNSFIHTQTCYYFRILKLIPFSRSSIRDESGFYLKILVQYLQFSQLLVAFLYEFPLQINFLPEYVGTSITKLVIGIECILPENLIKSLGKVRLLCILISFLPLLYIFICGIYSLTVKQLFKTSFSKFYIYPTFALLFTFFQPEVILQYTNILACRQIGDDEVFLVDLKSDCYEKDLRDFANYFAYFNLSVWFFVPLIVFLFFQRRKNNLDDCITKYKYGYFYMELKPKFYYWEFVRIYFKIILILLFTLQKQNYYFIAIVQVFMAITIYLIQISRVQPFISKRLTDVEILSFECILFKLCCQIIAQRIEMPQIQILTIITDYFFIGYIALIIFYFKMNNRFSIFGRFTRYIFRKVLSKQLYIRLTRTSRKKFRTFMLWKKIQKNLLNIIEFKASDNIIYVNKNPKYLKGNNSKIDKNYQNYSSYFLEKKVSQENTQIIDLIKKSSYISRLEDSKNEETLCKENSEFFERLDSDYKMNNVSQQNSSILFNVQQQKINVKN